MKVLLVAYACRPGASSEREVGWKWANLIQSRHDVTVLTRETHRPHIEAYLAKRADIAPALDFIYYDLPPWVRRFKKGYAGLYVYYGLWSFFATLHARRRHREKRFDVTHFLTFGTLLWPQFSFLMPTAYVLGPVGGGEHIPAMMRRAFGPANGLKLVFRGLAQWALFANPFFWANILAADQILVRTRETLDMLPRRVYGKTELFLETAMPDWVVGNGAPPRDNEVLTIIAVGRLIYWKINRLTFDALADFKGAWGRPFRFLVVGDGPELNALKRMAADLGLQEVEFLGACSGDKVMALMRGSDIYFSTTTKEGGTWAFFEAIGNRLPVVCLKVNGPDMIVGDGCGVKVPPESYERARAGLAQGLLALARDPGLRDSYADKALAFVERTYSWDLMLDRIHGLYREALAGRAEAPP